MSWRSTSLCLLVTLLIPAYRVSRAQERETSELSAVQYWQQQLQAPSPTMRSHAAAALSRFGSEASPALKDLYGGLADEHPQVRMHSAQALGYLLLEPATSISRLLPLLDDANEHVRYAAEWSLARFAMLPVTRTEAPKRLEQYQKAIARLEQRKHHLRHRQVIEQAIGAVEALLATPAEPIASSPKSAVDDAIKQRRKTLQRLAADIYRYSLMQRLSSIQRLSIRETDPAIESQRTTVQQQVLEKAYARRDFALIRFANRHWGQEAEEARKRIVQSHLWQSSMPDWLPKAIVDCQTLDRAHLGKLSDCARNPTAPTSLRQAAIESLGRSGDTSLADLDSISAMAAKAALDDSLRITAIEALSNLAALSGPETGPTNKSASLLFTIVADGSESWELRLAAAKTLAEIAPDRLPDTIDLMVRSLGQQSHGADEELGALLSWLAKIPTLPQAAVAPIHRGLASQLPNTRAIACACTANLGEVPDELIRRLLERFSDPSETHKVLLAGVKAIEELGTPATQLFVEESRHVPAYCLTQALWAIAENSTRSPELVDLCNRLCSRTETPTDVKCAAAAVLGTTELVAQVDINCLRATLDDNTPAGVRSTALIALARLKKIQLADVQRLQASWEDALGQVSAVYARYLLGDPNALHAMISMLSPMDIDEPDKQAEPFSREQLIHGLLLEIGIPAIGPLWDVAIEPSIPTEIRVEAVVQLASMPQANVSDLLQLVDDPRLGRSCVEQILRASEKQPASVGDTAVDRLVRMHQNSRDSIQRDRLEQLTEQLYAIVANPSTQPPSAKAKLSLPPEGRRLAKSRASVAHSPGTIAAAPSMQPLPMKPLHSENSATETSESSQQSSSFSDLLRRQTNTNRFLCTASRELLEAEPVEIMPAAARGLDFARDLKVPPIASDLPATTLGLPRGGEAYAYAPATAPTPAFEAPAVERSPSALQLAPLRESIAPLSAQPTAVSVFYGTNRKASSVSYPAEAPTESWPGVSRIWIAGLFVIAFYWLSLHFRRSVLIPATLATGATVLFLTIQIAHRQMNSVQDQGRLVTYGTDFDQQLALGICKVSIPAIHQKGQLESPSVFRMELKPDADKHILLRSTTELEAKAFFNSLDSEMESKGRNLLVFIHGYNVGFEDAARRAAQMAYDLEFPGAPVFYSWPSNGNWYHYKNDRENIQRSVHLIKQFLSELAEQSQADSIHLVAHSMGNVGLTQALAELAPKPEPTFNHVILAAPDIDADVFHRDIAPRIEGKAKRYTMYVSNNDLALLASRYFNAGRRLGETLPAQRFPHIDVVDASGVDTSLLGHSYYGGLSVLNDLSEVLADRPLSERTFLKTETVGGIARTVFNLPKIASSDVEDQSLDR